MAVRIADTLKQQNNLTTFPVAYGEDIWLDENKGSGTANYDTLQNLYNDGKLGGSDIEVTTMPAASESYIDKVLLYIGETGTYKYGTYYKCVSDGETPPTYSWVDAEIGGGTKIFYGTMDEWNALSTDAKKQYDYMSDSQSGNENTFWSGFTTIDEITHLATTTDYDFEVTLPSDGYYCATIDMSIGKQKVIVFVDDGLGTYYTFKTFIAQEERTLERYILPYLPAGRIIRIRHAGINGEASGQVTLKLQRVDFS